MINVTKNSLPELKIMEIIKIFNPLRISKCIRDDNGLNLIDISFYQWIKYCDELKDIGLMISFQEIMNQCLEKLKYVENINDVDNNIISDPQVNNNLNQLEKLFEHNEIIYYGDRIKMYKSMQILNGMNDLIYDPLIELAGYEPRYLIDLYVKLGTDSNHKIDTDPDEDYMTNILKQIYPIDILDFIKFIERYPLNNLSINILEFHLIDYFKRYRIDWTQPFG